MHFKSNAIFKTFFVILFSLAFARCVHDTSISLSNSTPQIISPAIAIGDTLKRSLYYPDTLICTLKVKDLNDNEFTIENACWPWYYKMINDQENEAAIALFVEPSFCGSFIGTAILQDPAGAKDSFPFVIDRRFADNFNSVGNDLSNWGLYDPNDTISIDISGPNGFSFLTSEQDSNTGVISNFRLDGDFSFKTNLRLVTQYGSIWEIALLLSSSSDPLFATGAGVKFAYNRQFRFTTFEANGSSSVGRAFSNPRSGVVRITRSGDMLYAACSLGTVIKDSVKIDPGSVYIHFSAITEMFSVAGGQLGIFDDFEVTKGSIYR